jgi:hypothetical protein
MSQNEMTPTHPRYDIALSFAGEDRKYVEAVAEALRAKGIRVFYDGYEEASLWGKDLYTHLSQVYEKDARFTVMFISHHYAEKLLSRAQRELSRSSRDRSSQRYTGWSKQDGSSPPGASPRIIVGPSSTAS